MKILVTGGAGYIGTLLIPQLLDKGHKVKLFDNFMWGVKPILHFAAHNNFEIESGDVRDKEAIRTAVNGCDVVIHLAAIVGYPACAADHNRAVTTNLDGTRNIVESLSKDQKILFASTGSTYGKVEGVCTEETPIDPLTLYGKTKWESEKLVRDVGGVSLRFATVFGAAPRLRLDLLVNDFIYQAIHNKQIVLFEGHFRRTFLHSKDAAKSYLFTLDNLDKMAGESYNVGDNKMNYTKKQVAFEIAKKIDYYLHEADVGEDMDKRDYEVSYEKINSLGYAADISLQDGIDELVKILKHITVINEWRNA
jgi:nucleoside-diphosphate-sugar epimerase